jgi:hypothetical protein
LVLALEGVELAVPGSTAFIVKLGCVIDCEFTPVLLQALVGEVYGFPLLAEARAESVISCKLKGFGLSISQGVELSLYDSPLDVQVH